MIFAFMHSNRTVTPACSLIIYPRIANRKKYFFVKTHPIEVFKPNKLRYDFMMKSKELALRAKIHETN